MSSAPLHQVLAVAVVAAVEAGAYIRSRLSTAKDVTIKTSLADVVTDVDPACERMIRDHIAAVFPAHDVLGEETTDPGSEAAAEATSQVAAAHNLWVIDPLDGTTNFVCGLPLSVVSIGYAEAGKLLAGVVYDPYQDELFVAGSQLGAWLLNAAQGKRWAESEAGRERTDGPLPGLRITVSKAKQLHESLVATGFPARGITREQSIAAGVRVGTRVKSFRALGAAALHLAYVAAGRIDAFWEYDLNAWDLAAGVCLIEEAGGVTRSLDGRAYDLGVRDLVTAATPELAQALTAVIAGAEGTRA